MDSSVRRFAGEARLASPGDINSKGRIVKMLVPRKQIFKWLCIGLAGALVLAAGSCSTLSQLSNIQKPTLSVADVRFTGMSFDAVDLAFDVKIRNPNQLSATLAGFDYDFKINDNSFLKGQQEKKLAIEALGESTVEVPLTLNFKDIYQTFATLKEQDSSAYQMDLGLDFDLPVLGKTRIPVSKTGFLPMIKLPALKIASVKVNQMGLGGADLELNLEIDNPNGFGVLAKNLNYDFSVNGQSWVKGIAPEQVRIAEKGQSLIRIPISLDLLSMGQAALQLLSGNQTVDYAFQGKMDLDTSLPAFKNINFPISKSGQLKITR